MRKYVVMGVQGSGKGTQSTMLCRDFDLVHIVGTSLQLLLAVGAWHQLHTGDARRYFHGAPAFSGTSPPSSTCTPACSAGAAAPRRAATAVVPPTSVTGTS